MPSETVCPRCHSPITCARFAVGGTVELEADPSSGLFVVDANGFVRASVSGDRNRMKTHFKTCAERTAKTNPPPRKAATR